jgi:hypothetical protein
MILKKRKSISWKTAFGIVVFLHLAVYGAVTQYGSYKKKMAEQMKDRKEKLYVEKESKPEWNNKHVKLRVVAVPIPQKIHEKQNVIKENKVKDLIASSVNGLNESLASIDSIKNTFQSEIKKIENPFTKKEVKSHPIKVVVKEKPHIITPPKPVVKDIPKPKPILPKPAIVNIVPPKQIIKNSYTPTTPRPSKATRIPIVSEPSREIKVRNIVIESDGSIVETSEEIRRVVSSQVVL